MANLNPFSKVLQKQAGRAKERLLQNLGKADRTADEDFDLHVKNFSKQQHAVLRLQKEFKNYHQCLKAMQAARRTLMDTVCELYEPCWDGVEEFLLKSEVSNRTFEEFCDDLSCQILVPVGNYLGQFPEIMNKISKRNRKLLDYDNSRHNLQNLETMKKKEDSKLAKAKEQLEDARNNFDCINNELHEELPTLYDSRVEFFATHLQCLFATEYNYHTKDAITCSEIGELLKKLKTAYEEGAFAEKPNFSSPQDSEFFLAREKLRSFSLTSVTKEDNAVSEEKQLQEDKLSSESASGSTAFSTPTTTIERNASLDMESVGEENKKAKSESKGKKAKPSEEKTAPEHESPASPVADKPGDVSKLSNPANSKILYQVKGTYKYAAEDVDELSFDVGDVIDVVEYEDPEEQEEGWLMGIFNGKKGLFPANFTSRM